MHEEAAEEYESMNFTLIMDSVAYYSPFGMPRVCGLLIGMLAT